MTDGSIETETVKPVALKYCVEQKDLESLLGFGFIDSISIYDELQGADLQKYSESQVVASRNDVTIEKPDSLIRSELRINKKDDKAVIRERNLFIAYHKLLRKHRVSRPIEDNPKLATRSVYMTIRPKALRTRLKTDISIE